MTLILISLAVLAIVDFYEQVTAKLDLPPWSKNVVALFAGTGFAALLFPGWETTVLHGFASAGLAGLLRVIGTVLVAVRTLSFNRATRR